MSATERVRELLDERGVEYETDDEDGCEFTEWMANGLEWEADSRGELVYLTPVMLITPEQAIAATLGSCNCSNDCTNSERTGTCNADETETWECVCDQIGRYGKRVTVHVMECSECGHTYEHVNGDYEFCPHCGRRVVEVNA